jgi:hypothetical protein
MNFSSTFKSNGSSSTFQVVWYEKLGSYSAESELHTAVEDIPFLLSPVKRTLNQLHDKSFMSGRDMRISSTKNCTKTCKGAIMNTCISKYCTSILAEGERNVMRYIRIWGLLTDVRSCTRSQTVLLHASFTQFPKCSRMELKIAFNWNRVPFCEDVNFSNSVNERTA